MKKIAISFLFLVCCLWTNNASAQQGTYPLNFIFRATMEGTDNSLDLMCRVTFDQKTRQYTYTYTFLNNSLTKIWLFQWDLFNPFLPEDRRVFELGPLVKRGATLEYKTLAEPTIVTRIFLVKYKFDYSANAVKYSMVWCPFPNTDPVKQ